MGSLGALFEHEQLRDIIDRSAAGEVLTVTDREFLRTIADRLERSAEPPKRTAAEEEDDWKWQWKYAGP